MYSISRVTSNYRAWNAEIIPFILRVHQQAFRYLIYLDTLRYLPQHGVVGVRTGNLDVKFQISLLCSSLQCFHQADLSSFLASDFLCTQRFGKKILTQTKSPVAPPPLPTNSKVKWSIPNFYKCISSWVSKLPRIPLGVYHRLIIFLDNQGFVMYC